MVLGVSQTPSLKIIKKENMNMEPIEIMKRQAAYANGYENIPTEAQNRAKQLCWEYNRTALDEILLIVILIIFLLK